MMAIIDQRFSLFQSVMLQTMKELVINMVPQLSNQQQSYLRFPSPNDMLHTQLPTYLYHIGLLQQPDPPNTTPQSPLANMSPPSSHPDAPPIHIPPQPLQRIIPPSNQMLPPPPTSSYMSTNSTTQQFQNPLNIQWLNLMLNFNCKTPCN